jgi:hypothetical protein
MTLPCSFTGVELRHDDKQPAKLPPTSLHCCSNSAAAKLQHSQGRLMWGCMCVSALQWSRAEAVT